MEDHLSGRGAQINPANKFLQHEFVTEHKEGIDEDTLLHAPKTQFIFESPKTIVNTVDSPDLKMTHSLNPYQGCEHGCAYCYARNVHQYWGFSAGLDFETKIVVKKNAPDLLSQFFQKRTWKSSPIALSGNTDCYQPAERKFKITRALLEVFLKYQNPVGIITKNVLVSRDIDILKELASNDLVHVYFSLTTLDDKLRRVLEPRTATVSSKLKTIEKLANAGIPVGIMNAPIIPGLNEHEMPHVIRRTAEAGARSAGYTVLRLNGPISTIFYSWLKKHFPDRSRKIWHKVQSMHGGNVNDSEWGRRMRGDGNIADTISQLFNQSIKKYLSGNRLPEYNLSKFSRNGTMSLF